MFAQMHIKSLKNVKGEEIYVNESKKKWEKP
jgi:hypothetical protein